MNAFDSVVVPVALVVGLAVGWTAFAPAPRTHEPAVSPPCPLEAHEAELPGLALDVELMELEKQAGGW